MEHSDTKNETTPEIRELTADETWDVLYFSFMYSQGDGVLQDQMLEAISKEFKPHPALREWYSQRATQNLPEKQLARYKNFLRGAHEMNTDAPVSDETIKAEVSSAIAGTLGVSKKSGLAYKDLLFSIISRTLKRDYKFLVQKPTRRRDSFALKYIRDMQRPVGPEPYRVLFSDLHAVFEEFLQKKHSIIFKVPTDDSDVHEVISMPTKQIMMEIESVNLISTAAK